MSKNNLSLLLALVLLVIMSFVAYRNMRIEVQTGKTTQCLQAYHKGNRVIGSTITKVRVPRKDANKFKITYEYVTCSECDRYLREIAAQQEKEKRVADEYIHALLEHDNAILLCCRDLTAIFEANNYQWSPEVVTCTKKLGRLARKGKQISAPQQFGDIESAYCKSMDALIEVAASTPNALENRDVATMKKNIFLLAESTIYRDEAINKLPHH